MKFIESRIKEIREKIEPFKEFTEYAKHMGELHKNMQKKDLKNKNTRKKKYLRDLVDKKSRSSDGRWRWVPLTTEPPKDHLQMDTVTQ